ncbi:SHD1 domain-containing protein [Blastopirellula marina]|uniref:SLA1 homology domain-containing protein n=1 Tax=Blastopirellula marina DSM 3645 TaxID=314230 RepID=A3ZUR6_9BACT|nr:SHD1 domain-containing protein [Blastopirellula marina]EAQ79652.1 hypothetical protein DSM3645_24125 [Blastopirellula marina DSM 3645]
MESWILLAAENEMSQSQSLLWAAAIGLLILGGGVYGIVTKSLLISRRAALLFSLVGLNESTPGFPALIGSCYCVIGVIVLFACGSQAMKEQEDTHDEARQVYQLPDMPAPMSVPMSKPVVPKPVVPETPEEKAKRQAEELKHREAQEEARRRAEEDRKERMRKEAERVAAQQEEERIAKLAAEKMQQQKEAARRAALELPKPPQSLDYFSYPEGSIQKGKPVGRGGGDSFEDRAPPGGVMVGAIFFIGDYYVKSVAGIQPIYQIGDQYVKGQICGNETDRPVQQLAEPGGVAAGFKSQTGRIIDGMQLAYGPLNGTKINPKQGYFGDYMGSDTGYPANYYADGKTIAGVFGTYEKGKSLTSLGMYAIRQMQVTESAPTTAPMEIRTFTSANGKFTVQAKLLKVNDDGTVSLEKADGSIISAPAASLSDVDQAYIRANQ